MKDLRISKEKDIMKRFLKEVTKTENNLAVYGEDQIRRALNNGALGTLIISENLRKFRVKLKCPSCEYLKELTLSEKELENFDPPKCKRCGNSSTMEIENKIDFIDEISDLAEKKGCKVRLISMDSEEGDSLFSAFNGIAGILRYPIDI